MTDFYVVAKNNGLIVAKSAPYIFKNNAEKRIARWTRKYPNLEISVISESI